MNIRPVFLALLTGLSAAPTARAADCAFSDDLTGVRSVATITPGDARVYFAETPGAAGRCANARCPYVTQGDSVALGERSGDAVCATFTSKAGRATTGWLPAGRLVDSRPAARDWEGRWGDRERAVTIKAVGGGIAVDARLSIQNGGPVFSGAFKAKLETTGPILSFAVDEDGRQTLFDQGKDGACRVKLVLAGPVLLVHDEGCVGLGSPATFEGAYTRAKARP